MPINIEWQVNPSVKKEKKTRLFPRITDSETVGENKLTELIASHGLLSRGNAKMALDDLAEVMSALLREGKTIDLPQIGSPSVLMQKYILTATSVCRASL